MNRKFRILPFIILISFSMTSFSQSFHSTIKNVYDFNPRTLNDAEMTEVSLRLDSLWSVVKSDTTFYLNELRKELADSTHAAFFYFDGSNLLMSLSQAKSDLKIISTALLKCDIKGIQCFDYFRMAYILSFNKINTIEIAKKILSEEEFKPFIAQHAMYWSKDLCLVWLLQPLDENMHVDEIIPLFNEANDDSKMAILSYLWYSCTCEGEMFIEECARNKNLGKDIRKHALVLVEMDLLERSNNEAKLLKLKEERAQLLMGIGDEVLMDYVAKTKEIKKEYLCR